MVRTISGQSQSRVTVGLQQIESLFEFVRSTLNDGIGHCRVEATLFNLEVSLERKVKFLIHNF
jgi:hypothetical protein